MTTEQDSSGRLAVEPLSLRVTQGLAKVALAMRSHAWQRGSQAGLTPTQAQVLVVLGRSRGGQATVTELADALAVAPATVSQSLRALERKGLIRRSLSQEDRRVHLVSLTDEGHAAAGQVAQWPDFMAKAVEELPYEEQVAFLKALVRMVRRLQEEGYIQVARMCISCRFFRPNVHDDPLRPHHCAFVDAPFGDDALRLDCPDYQRAEAGTA